MEDGSGYTLYFDLDNPSPRQTNTRTHEHTHTRQKAYSLCTVPESQFSPTSAEVAILDLTS